MGEQDVRITGTAPNALQDRTFLSVSVTEGGRPRPLVPGTRIRLAFTAHGISARAGCNTQNVPVAVGPGTLDVDGPVSSTLIGCSAERHAQDEWLAGFLTAEPRWVETASGLTLSTDDVRIVLAEEGAEPRPPWGRTFVSTSVTEFGGPRPLEPGTAVRMRFSEPEQLTADVGCNVMTCAAQVGAGRGILIGGEVTSTDQSCGAELDAQDAWLSGFLSMGPTGSLVDGLLTVGSDGTEIVLTELVPAPSELWGRNFVAISVGETGIVPAPIVPGTEISLRFGEPGRLTAHAGCNFLTFRLDIDDTHLRVADDVSTTRIGCSDDMQAQDEWLAAFLVDDPAYAFTGDSLTLTRGGTEMVLVSKELM